MLDPLRQFKYGSYAKVTFPNFPDYDLPPQWVKIVQEAGKHEIAIIYYRRLATLFTKASATGIPVKIEYGGEKAKAIFTGYLVNFESTSIRQIEQGMTLTCVGASYPLKDVESKIWVNRTASDIVTDIAKKFHLTPKVSPHPIRMTQQSLAGHTYWEKVLELADKVGYVAQVIGTELHFHPLDTMLDQFMASIPILDLGDPLAPPEALGPSAPTLNRFHPLLTDYNEMAESLRSVKSVSGVDPLSGKAYNVISSPDVVGKNLRKDTKTPLFNTVETRRVIASQKMAKAFADAEAQRARLGITAEGDGQGDPRISPYQTVQISGTGNVTDGYWVITKATHSLAADGRYAVDFECRVDGLGANKASATRPASAAAFGTRNVAVTTPGSQRSTSLSKVTATIRQTDAGFTRSTQRWVGR